MEQQSQTEAVNEMKNLETHRTGTVVDVDTLAPRVLSVDVAAVEVDVRCFVGVGDGVLAR